MDHLAAAIDEDRVGMLPEVLESLLRLEVFHQPAIINGRNCAA
jgi:hypothetical protein